MRPSSIADQPEVLLDDTEEIYIGVDPPVFKLEGDADGFSLNYTAAQGLDLGRLIRPHVDRYRIEQDLVTRIPPLAEAPEDFFDEWLHVEWDEASRWADAAALSELQRMHRALNEGGGYRAEEILSVNPCADGNTWQVGLEIRAVPDELQGQQPEESQEAMADQLFFTIGKRNGAFFVQGVTSQSPPDCSGGAGSVH
jgi:hypothetical protein